MEFSSQHSIYIALDNDAISIVIMNRYEDVLQHLSSHSPWSNVYVLIFLEVIAIECFLHWDMDMGRKLFAIRRLYLGRVKALDADGERG